MERAGGIAIRNPDPVRAPSVLLGIAGRSASIVQRNSGNGIFTSGLPDAGVCVLPGAQRGGNQHITIYSLARAIASISHAVARSGCQGGECSPSSWSIFAIFSIMIAQLVRVHARARMRVGDLVTSRLRDLKSPKKDGRNCTFRAFAENLESARPQGLPHDGKSWLFGHDTFGVSTIFTSYLVVSLRDTVSRSFI